MSLFSEETSHVMLPVPSFSPTYASSPVPNMLRSVTSYGVAYFSLLILLKTRMNEAETRSFLMHFLPCSNESCDSYAFQPYHTSKQILWGVISQVVRLGSRIRWAGRDSRSLANLASTQFPNATADHFKARRIPNGLICARVTWSSSNCAQLRSATRDIPVAMSLLPICGAENKQADTRSFFSRCWKATGSELLMRHPKHMVWDAQLLR